MNRLIKTVLRRAVTRHWSHMRMRPGQPTLPSYFQAAGLYLHVPFCRNLCPFCPYNRWEFEDEAFKRFEKAVVEEVSSVGRFVSLGSVPSFYIGGGTPTIDIDGLIRIMTHIRRTFGTPVETCIELHPAWASLEVLQSLKDWGVTMVSIGAQSFAPKQLEALGRKHTADDARTVIDQAAALGFETVNVDILFALPGQDEEDLRADTESAIKAGATQISTYPLFAFPYAELGQSLGLRYVKRPNGRLIRKMLSVIDDAARGFGLRRCAVWSWMKPGIEKFSSVSRHHYLGFGPSAASMTGQQFYVNTFHVDPYARATGNGGTTALLMDIDQDHEMAYWLYWRLYEMVMDKDAFTRLFGRDLDATYGLLFLVPRLMGWMRRTKSGYKVTDRGGYWIHRLQNEFSLDYIVKLWGPCRKAPWPAEVRL